MDFKLYTFDRSLLLRSIDVSNVNTKLKDGTTLMHIAALFDDAELAKVLFDLGANVTINDSNKNALDIAVMNDSYHFIEKVVESFNNFGWKTYSELAMEYNHPSSFRLLFEALLSQHDKFSRHSEYFRISTFADFGVKGYKNNSLECLRIFIEIVNRELPDIASEIFAGSVVKQPSIVKHFTAVEMLVKGGAQVLLVDEELHVSLFVYVFALKKTAIFRKLFCEKAYGEMLQTSRAENILNWNWGGITEWADAFDHAISDACVVSVKMLLQMLFSIAVKLGTSFDVVCLFIGTRSYKYLEKAIQVVRLNLCNERALRVIEMLLMIGIDRSTAISSIHNCSFEEFVKLHLQPESAKRILSFHHNVTLFDILDFRRELSDM